MVNSQLAEAKISEVIRERLKRGSASLVPGPTTTSLIICFPVSLSPAPSGSGRSSVRDLLHTLVIDTENDHNTA